MKKRSFFRKLTGSIRLSEDEEVDVFDNKKYMGDKKPVKLSDKNTHDEEVGFKEEEEEGELTVDLYQTPREMVVQTMVAGVQPENLNIMITRDSITIKGKREEVRGVDEDSYFFKELYWGSFSRTLELPVEVEPEEAEATERHGLLIIKIPKIDKHKQTNLKVRSI